MIVSKVLSSIVNGIRQIKVACMGLKDARTATQLAPFGVDSQPLPNIRVVYANTTKAGNSFIIGCVNINNQAQDGEFRAYSLDSNGDLATYIWLHNVTGPGQIEIGGTADNAVGYNNLATQFNELKTKVNNLVNAFNSHVHASSGATPTPVPGLIPATPSSADITQAKKEEIKTI